jgi:hypothetical protein
VSNRIALVREWSREVANVFENRVVRPVRIFAEQLTFDGLLNISLGARTLDELNLGARSFLTLATPQLVTGSWDLIEGPVAINKASVLLVVEIPDLGASLGRTDEDPEMRRFGRAAIHLKVREYAVEGFVHTGPGGSSLTRLNQSAHPFIALQSAVVVGPGVDFSASFLAINRAHVLSAQEMFSVNLVAEEVLAGTGEEES